jgi:hypothetical protein
MPGVEWEIVNKGWLLLRGVVAGGREGELLNKRQNNNKAGVAAGVWGKPPEIFKLVHPHV